MKLWIDPTNPAPFGWLQATEVVQAIAMHDSGRLEVLTLGIADPVFLEWLDEQARA